MEAHAGCTGCTGSGPGLYIASWAAHRLETSPNSHEMRSVDLSPTIVV
jgi:hypothetical protein